MAAGEFTIEIPSGLPQDLTAVSFDLGDAEMVIADQYFADGFTLANRPVIAGFSVYNYGLTITARVPIADRRQIESFFSWQQTQFRNILSNGGYWIDADASSGASSIVVDNGQGGQAKTRMQNGDIFSITGSSKIYTAGTVTQNTPTANEDTVALNSPLDQDVLDGDLISIACRARLQFTDEVYEALPMPSPHPKTLLSTSTTADGYEYGFPIYDAFLTLEDGHRSLEPANDGRNLITFTVREASFS